MNFIKYTDFAKIEKYINDIDVVTFTTTRNSIDVTRSRHSGRQQHIQELLQAGYTRAAKERAGA